MKVVDLTEKKIGFLTVNKRAESRNGDTYWSCTCQCGKVVNVRSDHLQSNRVRSCGCQKGKLITEKKIKHGMRKTRLYRIWASMIQRCENTKSHEAYLYSERGITVCPEWHEFEIFKNWALSNGYAENLTIERIDNNKGYSSDNCKWATIIEQANNKRTNVRIEYNGLTKTLAQWAREFEIDYRNLWQRLKRGWSFEQAINTGVGVC
jgi:hypothetical protein